MPASALRRASVFDSAGNYGRSSTILDADTLGDTFPVGVLGDGRLLLASYHEPAPANGLRRDSVMLRIGSPTGTIQADIGRFPWVDQVIEVRSGGISMSRTVFGRLAYWGTLDSLVLVASNDRFSFDWYGADGRLKRSVRRQWTPVPVTTADDETTKRHKKKAYSVSHLQRRIFSCEQTHSKSS